MTQQGDRQASVRAITGTALTYEGDFMAMFDGAGIAAGDFDGRFLAWINKTLGATYTEINGAMQAYAATFGAANWSSLGTLDPYPAATVALDFVGPVVAGLPFYKVNGVVYTAPSSIPGWTFARASTKTALNSSGAVVAFGSGIPAITDLGFLVEAASTNLLPNSNTFTSWTVLSGVSAVQNTAAPDGTNTGWTFTQTGANASDSRAQNNVTVANDGASYTYSIYIPKLASAPAAYPAISMGLVGGTGVSVGVVINPVTGAILFTNGSVGSTTSRGNFWFVQVTLTNNTTGNTTLFTSYYPAWNAAFSASQSTVNGASNKTAFAQAEAGTSATSYIATTGAAATRAADVAAITGLTAQAATLYFEGVPTDDPSAGSTNRSLASINDTTGNNRNSMFRGSSGSAGVNFRNIVAGIATSPSVVAESGTGLIKAAIAASAARSMGAANGVLSASAGSPAGLAGWTQLQIGLDLTNPQFNGYVRRTVLYPSAFSDAPLQVLTQ